MPSKDQLADWGYGDPDAPGYQRDHISSFTAAGLSLTCHRDLVPVFHHLVSEMGRWGIDLTRGARDDWGYQNRDTRSTPGVKSWHSVGAAVDLDATRNPVGSKTTTFPVRKTTVLCEDLGLTWGRVWSRPDPMHFEVAHPLAVMVQIGARLREEAEDRPPFRRTLTQGDVGPAVRWAQARLKAHGFYDGPINGRFTWATHQAVKRFEGARGFRVNGTIGSHVYDALTTTP